MTFEAANLDFAGYYRDKFKEVDDLKTANIMNIVYEDEIKHVALGAKWLNSWRGDLSLWGYFRESLPHNITPSRAKGMSFDVEARVRSGLGEDFIQNVRDYKDDYIITTRREWE